MTHVLLITNKNDVTTDYIVKKLKEKQVSFYRLNTEEICVNVSVHFDFKTKTYCLYDTILDITVDLLLVKSVYFRRPEINNRIVDLSAAENLFIVGEIGYTLEGLYKILRNAHWLNSVDAIRAAENKIYQLQLAEEIGFTIPDSIITTKGESAVQFLERNNEDCIIKPIRTGLISIGDTEEGIIFTSRVNLDDKNAKRVTSCPTYFQKHISKSGDVRATVVGDKVFAALIHSQESDEAKIDWRQSQFSLRHTEIELPQHVKEKCIQLTQILSLNFGAIDLILDKNDDFIFLEINPNGQWAWIERILGLEISEEIVSFLTKKFHDA